MSYTYPIGQPQGEPAQFTNILREILIAEIYAMHGYQQHIADSNMAEINTVWHSIMLDEKKHYGWLLVLLRKYDPEEEQAYQQHLNARLSPNTPMQAYKPDYGRQIILNNIRQDIKGELEAVVLYEEQLQHMPYLDLRQTLQNIISDEKGHAEHLTRLLLKYDPDPYDGLT